MLVQRFRDTPLQVNGAYTQDVIRSFVNELKPSDVYSWESVRLTFKPNDPSMDRHLEIYAYRFPRMWNKDWAASERDLPMEVQTFSEDIARECERVIEYWEEHRRDHRDVFGLPGQKRLADAVKSYGCSYVIHAESEALGPRVMQERFSKAYIALAKACNEGRLATDEVMELSIAQYPFEKSAKRIKLNTNQPPSLELFAEITKILIEQDLTMRIKVKTSIATYLAFWARSRGYPQCSFTSPIKALSNSIDEVNLLLARTSLI
ncbi:unnamed protein product, partial [Mesorhabditis spiculigera]